jgi:hypothetical protein
VILLLGGSCCGQGFVLSNEIEIFSFHTRGGKKVLLAKDSSNRYLIYRFGNKKNVMFEYPEKDENSFKKFQYSFYLRGGGSKQNGIDLNYLFFRKEHIKYCLFSKYYVKNKKLKIGLKITDLKKNKTVTYHGLRRSLKGNLTDFRDNNLVQVVDELFGFN